MLFSRVLQASLVIPFAFAASPAIPPNALALIEQQKDLTIITKLIKRDPVLVELYKNVKDVTIFAANDVGFGEFNDINRPPLSDVGLVRNILTYINVEGIYPTSEITPKAKYLSTKLTNTTYVNLSRGKQVARLAEMNGKKTALFGDGTIGFLAQGAVYCKSLQIDISYTIKQINTNPASEYYALTNLSSRGYLDKLDKTKDVTLFTITNAAWKKLVDSKGLNQAVKFLGGKLGDYAITPGVYYGDRFTGKIVKTLSGKKLTLAGFGKGQLTVNKVKVAKEDIITANGVVHVLASLL